MTTGITTEQYAQLLKPLPASRVANRSQAGTTLAYLEAWDVKAHLIRIFGFGGWSADVIESALAFEEQNEKGQWHVGYKVTMRLTLHNLGPTGQDVTYTESAVGPATLKARGDAHDMAIKTAESDALKRCAINLGTQFGLSLYNNGSRSDIIGRTLNPPADYAGVEAEVEVVVQSGPVAPDGTADRIDFCTTEAALKVVWDEADAEGWLDGVLDTGQTVRMAIVDALTALREQS